MKMSERRRRYYEADTARLNELVARGEAIRETLAGVNEHVRVTFIPCGSCVDFWPSTGRWKPHPLNTLELANDGGLPAIERFVAVRRHKIARSRHAEGAR